MTLDGLCVLTKANISHWRGTVINKESFNARIQSCPECASLQFTLPERGFWEWSVWEVTSLDVELVNRQLVHEGPHEVICGEVKHQAEGYGDGESWKGLFEDRQEEES